jgi:hypothetical protein
VINLRCACGGGGTESGEKQVPILNIRSENVSLRYGTMRAAGDTVCDALKNMGTECPKLKRKKASRTNIKRNGKIINGLIT